MQNNREKSQRHNFFDFTNKVASNYRCRRVICGRTRKNWLKVQRAALLDLNEEAAQKFADEIIAESGIKAYKAKRT